MSDSPAQRPWPGSPASAATPRPTYVGDSLIANPGTLSNASRQLSSRTPKCSSIASDRIQPGVTASGVTGCSRSSCVRPTTIRCTHAFTKS